MAGDRRIHTIRFQKAHPMEVADINPKSVAEAVGGTVEHSGCVVCLCPIHETGGGHSPSMALSITDDRRILFTCRSQKCDRKHAGEIRRFLVEKGLPQSHVGGMRAAQTLPSWDYFAADGGYSWTKQKIVSKAGKKSFSCGVYDHANNDWIINSRPADAPLLFNLQTIAPVMGKASDTPLMIVEGEKDVVTATDLGVLATTNADGAGKWRVEDTRTLVGLGVKKAIICPDNDGAGFEHGVSVAKSLQGAGVEVRWLELPELGMKEDLSDWAPRQVDPKAALAELIANAPTFDEESLGWRSRLKRAGRDAPYLYRGDKMNIELALKFDGRLKGRFAWNAFRNRVEVVQHTPWCNPDWWSTSNLTPRGYRRLRDTDIVRLGNYLTAEYDYGDCSLTACRVAINAVAGDHEFDELKDWLDALPEWDGVGRLDNWLAVYCGADIEAHTSEYLAMVSSKYIMQALNRALNPGAKADYALVLTSSQGSGKDKILETTFAPYYSESVPSPRQSQADFAMAIGGSLVAHSAEMAAWKKSEVEDQKAALTRNVDRGRPAYGYEARDYPRRTSLAFSTNDIDFLRDATGDRRYWGVSIKREAVRLDELRRDRDQIFAEALDRLRAGEQHWPTPEEEDAVLIPNQRLSMPETVIEIVNTLERYILEKPRTPIPQRQFDWLWDERLQPLREIHLDDFFGDCFGMYTGVKRPNLDRASPKHVVYCTTWLRKNGWQRVETRRGVVWRSATSGPGGGSRRVDAKQLVGQQNLSTQPRRNQRVQSPQPRLKPTRPWAWRAVGQLVRRLGGRETAPSRPNPTQRKAWVGPTTN